jgi:hypothetical protein
MANSGTVTAGSVALASQYNNLRSDVLDASTGHTHSGAADAGAQVEGTALKSTGATAGHVLTAGAGGTATTWSALPAGAGQVTFGTATAAFSTAAAGTSVKMATGAANDGGIGLLDGGTVIVTHTNINNYITAAKIYKTFDVINGTVVGSASISSVAGGTYIADQVVGTSFEAGEKFVIKENHGSGSTWTNYLRKYNKSCASVWTTTLATFTLSAPGNQSEYFGPFGGQSENECGPKWASGINCWYGGDHRSGAHSTATTGGAGTVSVWIVNDTSGSAYSAPFGTSSTPFNSAFTYATVFVPADGTALGGTIYAWGAVQNSANTAQEFRQVAYAVGSASISAVAASTATSSAWADDIAGRNHLRPIYAKWDNTNSQIIVGLSGGRIVFLDRTASTVLAKTPLSSSARQKGLQNGSSGVKIVGRNDPEQTLDQQIDLTAGYALWSEGRPVLTKLGSYDSCIFPTSVMQTTYFGAAKVSLAGPGSATRWVYVDNANDGTAVSFPIAGVAKVTLAGTSSAAFRQITTEGIGKTDNVQILAFENPGGQEDIFFVGTAGTGLSGDNGGGRSGLDGVRYTHLVPGTATLFAYVMNYGGTGQMDITTTGTATFMTTAGTATLKTTTITLA